MAWLYVQVSVQKICYLRRIASGANPNGDLYAKFYYILFDANNQAADVRCRDASALLRH